MVYLDCNRNPASPFEIDEEVDQYSVSKNFQCPSNPHDGKIEGLIYSPGKKVVPWSSKVEYRKT